MMQPIHIPSISDAELLAECAGACADFKLEELEHVDPRDPAVRAPKLRASGTIGTRPYVLELIVIPNAVIAGARTTAEARRSVLEGFYRTVKRAAT